MNGDPRNSYNNPTRVYADTKIMTGKQDEVAIVPRVIIVIFG